MSLENRARTHRHDPAIIAALDTFVAAPEPFTIGFELPLDLRALADKLQLLPVILDMGGCIGLHPTGEVASFLWDEPTSLRPEVDARIRNMAYYRASLKYTELAPLVPRRSPYSVICSYCAGSGKCSGMPPELADKIVCYCGGLGWLPG